MNKDNKKMMDGLEGIDLKKAMKSDAVGVNGKPRKENISRFLSLYNRRLNDARYYFYKWEQSDKPVRADYNRAMDNLNHAYESMRDVLHEQMLIDAPTMDDRDKVEWNDLYWALPHNLFQFRDNMMNMLKESKYSSFCEVFDRLRSTRLEWKECA